MTLEDVQYIFNRAVFGTLDKRKLFLTFVVLVLSGVLVVFFRGVAIDASRWLALSLTFIPIFLCAGVLLSLGVLLIRIYHDEIKNRKVSYKKTLGKSWEVVIGASYFSVPVILCYLLLWMLLGIFVLLSRIPSIGDFFGVVLAFGPFLLNLGTLVLMLGSLALLFYLSPVLALKGFNRIQVSRVLVKRFTYDIFSNLFLLGIALLPLLGGLGILTASALLTGTLYYTSPSAVNTVLMWFFTMIPFTAILSPMVVFFFNFAAESHVLIMKKQREQANLPK
jgi:hypothetical protein